MSDDQIDSSDIPELPPAAWKDAVRGRFYRPVKQAVSMRLDADVIAWLKKPGKGYQTRANRILRQRMLDEIRRACGGGAPRSDSPWGLGRATDKGCPTLRDVRRVGTMLLAS